MTLCPMSSKVKAGFIVLVHLQVLSALQCYNCSSGYSNSNCNGQGETTCSTPSEVCYTEVIRSALVVKRYNKGCMNSVECFAKMGLNDVSACSETPSKCTYCCSSNLCNAANKSETASIPKQTLSFAAILVLLINMIG